MHSSDASIHKNGLNGSPEPGNLPSQSQAALLVRAALESTIDGLVALNQDGRIVFWNRRLAELLKVTTDALENKTRRELVDSIAALAKNPGEFFARINEQSSTPRTESTTLIELNDGRTLEHFTRPQWIDGAYAGVIFRFRDATERMRTKEALLESQALYQSLVNELPAGVFRKDHDGRYVFVNAWFCRLKHMGPERFLGKTTAEFAAAELALRPERRRDIENLGHQGTSDHEKILTTGKTIQSEEHYPAQDGHEELYLHVVKCPVFGSDGSVIGSQGILTDITLRKSAERELENVHRALVDASRQAGMAEVASSVLHNVGNVLNSINVSMSLITEAVTKSRVSNLARIADLIREHRENIGDFLVKDPKGSQLPEYICHLADFLNREQTNLVNEVNETRKHIEHVKEIVSMQQGFAKACGVTEKVSAVDLVEDALRLNSGALSRHQIQVVRDFPREAPQFTVERHKVLQILVNLIKNAKEACDESDQTEKKLAVRVKADHDQVGISIIDNGVGIRPENLTRIFNHGFTTRAHGHGFGLHSGALAAKEMGGSLTVNSDGPGKGATFLLQLPLNPPKTDES
jgi:PAS domain S-box-containing protein